MGAHVDAGPVPLGVVEVTLAEVRLAAAVEGPGRPPAGEGAPPPVGSTTAPGHESRGAGLGLSGSSRRASVANLRTTAPIDHSHRGGGGGAVVAAAVYAQWLNDEGMAAKGSGEEPMCTIRGERTLRGTMVKKSLSVHSTGIHGGLGLERLSRWAEG